MLNRVANKGIVPRGGLWKYRQPETNELITAHEWMAFLRKIKQHRRGHSIPLWLEVEAYVCEHQPEMCEDRPPRSLCEYKLAPDASIFASTNLYYQEAAGSPLV